MSVMLSFVAILRAFGFASGTLLIYGLWWLGRPITLWHKPLRLKWRSFIFRNWGRITLFMLGGRLHRIGTPPVAPPYILVSNHLSYIDIAVYAAHMHGVMVAKKEVASWALLGRMARDMGSIFVDRQNINDLVRVNAEIEQAIDDGLGVLIFPEGTSTKGDTVLPFMASLLEVPARRCLPVHFASLHYGVPASACPAHLSVCWWGEMTFFEHLFGVFKLPHFDAHLRFGPNTLQSNQRKALAGQLHQAVLALFQPVVVVAAEERSQPIQDFQNSQSFQ